MRRPSRHSDGLSPHSKVPVKDLPVQCLSQRDFLFPDAEEKYVPDVDATGGPRRAVLKGIFADVVSA
jgi:hypothetical protein